MSGDEWLPVWAPPAHNHLVLVCCEWGDRHIGHYLTQDFTWHFAVGYTRKDNPITHWQELPPPPTKK